MGIDLVTSDFLQQCYLFYFISKKKNNILNAAGNFSQFQGSWVGKVNQNFCVSNGVLHLYSRWILKNA